jgi:hypothetical protein
MVAVYSDFLFRDIGKEQLQARRGRLGLERQLGINLAGGSIWRPAIPARFIPSTV